MEEEQINTSGVCEQFMVEIWNYLASRFEDMPEYEIQEMSAYIANRFGVALMDAVSARDKEWNEYTKTMEKRYRNYYKQEYDRLRRQYLNLMKEQVEKQSTTVKEAYDKAAEAWRKLEE